MLKTKVRRFEARVEGLERREVMSHVHALRAVAPAFVAIAGSGFGQVTALAQTATGYQAAGVAYGADSRFGTFTAQASGSITNKGAGYATAVLTSPTGSELDLRFTGTAKSVHLATTSAYGTLNFTVTGGTGAFAHATGNGRMNVAADLTTGAVSFNYTGRLRP